MVNAYLIAFGGLLLLAGRLGDLIGQRRIFLIGLAVFTGASLLCAVAQTQGMLIGARFIQGAGGAIASAVILGMIVTMFPEPREQAKAIGVFSFVASAGASIGLLAGGVLTEAINWHWIFFVNVPIGIAIAFLARRLVEGREGIGLRAGADIPGALLITSGLMLGVYTILEAGTQGWGSTQTLGLGAISLILLAGFVVRQGRIETPLMPLRLFRSRNVAGANLVMALLVVGFFSMFFLGALYMQDILGYDPLEVGLASLPSCIVMGTLSLGFAERLIMGIGPRATLIAGVVFSTIGLLLFARAPVDGTWATDILPVMVLLGTGSGLAFPALMTLAMSGRHAERRGAGLGPGQHDRAGGWCDRPRGARDARRRAHRRSARRGGIDSLRAQRRLSPRLSDSGRAHRDGDRGRGDRARRRLRSPSRPSSRRSPSRTRRSPRARSRCTRRQRRCSRMRWSGTGSAEGRRSVAPASSITPHGARCAGDGCGIRAHMQP